MLNFVGAQVEPASQLDKVKYLLMTGTAVIVFRKATGELRVMLCSRNNSICESFGFNAYTKSNSKSNNITTVVVTDLAIGEPRQIKLSSIVYSTWWGAPSTPEDKEQLLAHYLDVKNQWANFDDLNDFNQKLFIDNLKRTIYQS